VISVNVGRIREATWKGRTFTTAIFKEPVSGRVQVAPGALIGDEHANTESHGGKLKALFAYRDLLERAMRLECATDRMRKTLADRFEHIARHSEHESEEF
jgi:MOSC domain-containing protein YiiM